MAWNTSTVCLPGTDPATVIYNLQLGVSGQSTAGLIITKQELRNVTGKNGEERGMFSFTIRDRTGTVNVTCWGAVSYIQQTYDAYQINDIVKLSNCTVSEKPDTDAEKVFQPTTSVGFRVLIDQKNSTIEPLNYGIEQFTPLLQKPVSQEGDYLPLNQLVNLQSSYMDKLLNLLVVIKTAPSKRSFVTKAGRNVTCCEFEVIDNSKSVLQLMLWMESLAVLTANLPPKQTILFLTDVKPRMNNFLGTMALNSTSKTIITVNPDIKSAHILYNFAQNLPDDIVNPSIQRTSKSSTTKVPISAIKAEFTIEELEDKMPENGILNAVLTKFDCADSKRKGVSKRCTGCNKKVPGLCEKAECSGKDVVPFYDFTVSFSDHTGTTDRVKLTGDCAEKLVGVPVLIFEDWGTELLAECMDRVQLERYRVYFTTFTMPSGLWLQVQQIDSWTPNLHSAGA